MKKKQVFQKLNQLHITGITYVFMALSNSLLRAMRSNIYFTHKALASHILSMMRPGGHEFLGAHSSNKRTRFPTERFLQGLFHF